MKKAPTEMNPMSPQGRERAVALLGVAHHA